MCLVVFAVGASDKYPLLVAANRDEFHSRPTRPAMFWPEHPQLLAGRDEQLGGTWMGVTREGRFAAVTNFRDPNANGQAPRSRGELPLDFLLGEDHPNIYLDKIQAKGGSYAGFNLLVGEQGNLWYFSNSLHGPDSAPRQLQPGLYGLSNAHLDTPWPKVLIGKERMTALLGRQSIDHTLLRDVVADTSLASQASLQVLGMETEMEQMLSAQFIKSELYGTRATTTLWFGAGGEISWQELGFDGTGQVTQQVNETLRAASRPGWE